MDGARSLRFSTRELSRAGGVGALRELFDRSIGMDVDAETDRAVDLQMEIAPGLRRARMLSPFTARAARSPGRLADNEDTVCLMLKTGGHMALTQGGREGVPQLGGAVLLVYRQPSTLQFLDATYLSIRVPFDALSALVDIDAAAARCVPRDAQALGLLRQYIDALPIRFADARLHHLAATHVYDLMALAIGATDEGREIATRRGVRAARFDAIKAALIQDPALSIEEAAARQGVSPRYVQMLFEEQGTTFSLFALEQRLDAARRMLSGPRHARWSIAAIAFEAGFGDLSYFNRRFKQRFGMTPREWRRERAVDGPSGAAAP